jgi:tRNA pseudouridine38-40 synthase
MVGCLKYLGEKKWDLKKFDKVFKSKKRVLCAPPAPPEGSFFSESYLLIFSYYSLRIFY